MKRFLLVTAIVILALPLANSQDIAEYYTVYLVRHAEKTADPGDPSLTDCGRERANYLAEYFSRKEISRIFSTAYNRTIETALPTAEILGLEIESYNPADLENFAAKLRTIAGNIVVVGHSNTTPELAGLLVGDKLTPIDDNEYGTIYQVILFEQRENFERECSTTLNIIKSDFVCEEDK